MSRCKEMEGIQNLLMLLIVIEAFVYFLVYKVLLLGTINLPLNTAKIIAIIINIILIALIFSIAKIDADDEDKLKSDPESCGYD